MMSAVNLWKAPHPAALSSCYAERNRCPNCEYRGKLVASRRNSSHNTVFIHSTQQNFRTLSNPSPQPVAWACHSDSRLANLTKSSIYLVKLASLESEKHAHAT